MLIVVLKDLGWFDNPKNSVGALTTRLATDAAQVQGVSSNGWTNVPQKVVAVIQQLKSLILLSVSFRPQVYAWRHLPRTLPTSAPGWSWRLCTAGSWLCWFWPWCLSLLWPEPCRWKCSPGTQRKTRRSSRRLERWRITLWKCYYRPLFF